MLMCGNCWSCNGLSQKGELQIQRLCEHQIRGLATEKLALTATSIIMNTESGTEESTV